MKWHRRYLTTFIKTDLKQKMVFLYGPRQVGKTSLSFTLLKNGNEQHPAYFNWDSMQDRQKLLNNQLPPHQIKKEDYETEGVRVLPFEVFCKELELP